MYGDKEERVTGDSTGVTSRVEEEGWWPTWSCGDFCALWSRRESLTELGGDEIWQWGGDGDW